MPTRSFAKCASLDDPDRKQGRNADGTYDTFPNDVLACPEIEANLISSKTVEYGPNDHMPAIDIDLPCRLVPSRTPGHFHLYIDHAIPWDKYLRMLDAMAYAGIVERGFADAARSRGATFLRVAPSPF